MPGVAFVSLELLTPHRLTREVDMSTQLSWAAVGPQSAPASGERAPAVGLPRLRTAEPSASQLRLRRISDLSGRIPKGHVVSIHAGGAEIESAPFASGPDWDFSGYQNTSPTCTPGTSTRPAKISCSVNKRVSDVAGSRQHSLSGRVLRRRLPTSRSSRGRGATPTYRCE